jgi:hypothetical protein
VREKIEGNAHIPADLAGVRSLEGGAMISCVTNDLWAAAPVVAWLTGA